MGDPIPEISPVLSRIIANISLPNPESSRVALENISWKLKNNIVSMEALASDETFLRSLCDKLVSAAASSSDHFDPQSTVISLLLLAESTLYGEALDFMIRVRGVPGAVAKMSAAVLQYTTEAKECSTGNDSVEPSTYSPALRPVFADFCEKLGVSLDTTVIDSELVHNGLDSMLGAADCSRASEHLHIARHTSCTNLSTSVDTCAHPSVALCRAGGQYDPCYPYDPTAVADGSGLQAEIFASLIGRIVHGSAAEALDASMSVLYMPSAIPSRLVPTLVSSLAVRAGAAVRYLLSRRGCADPHDRCDEATVSPICRSESGVPRCWIAPISGGGDAGFASYSEDALLMSSCIATAIDQCLRYADRAAGSRSSVHQLHCCCAGIPLGNSDAGCRDAGTCGGALCVAALRRLVLPLLSATSFSKHFVTSAAFVAAMTGPMSSAASALCSLVASLGAQVRSPPSFLASHVVPGSCALLVGAFRALQRHFSDNDPASTKKVVLDEGAKGFVDGVQRLLTGFYPSLLRGLLPQAASAFELEDSLQLLFCALRECAVRHKAVFVRFAWARVAVQQLLGTLLEFAYPSSTSSSRSPSPFGLLLVSSHVSLLNCITAFVMSHPLWNDLDAFHVFGPGYACPLPLLATSSTSLASDRHPSECSDASFCSSDPEPSASPPSMDVRSKIHFPAPVLSPRASPTVEQSPSRPTPLPTPASTISFLSTVVSKGLNSVVNPLLSYLFASNEPVWPPISRLLDGLPVCPPYLLRTALNTLNSALRLTANVLVEEASQSLEVTTSIVLPCFAMGAVLGAELVASEAAVDPLLFEALDLLVHSTELLVKLSMLQQFESTELSNDSTFDAVVTDALAEARTPLLSILRNCFVSSGAYSIASTFTQEHCARLLVLLGQLTFCKTSHYPPGQDTPGPCRQRGSQDRKIAGTVSAQLLPSYVVDLLPKRPIDGAPALPLIAALVEGIMTDCVLSTPPMGLFAANLVLAARVLPSAADDMLTSQVVYDGPRSILGSAFSVACGVLRCFTTALLHNVATIETQSVSIYLRDVLSHGSEFWLSPDAASPPSVDHLDSASLLAEHTAFLLRADDPFASTKSALRITVTSAILVISTVANAPLIASCKRSGEATMCTLLDALVDACSILLDVSSALFVVEPIEPEGDAPQSPANVSENSPVQNSLVLHQNGKTTAVSREMCRLIVSALHFTIRECTTHLPEYSEASSNALLSSAHGLFLLRRMSQLAQNALLFNASDREGILLLRECLWNANLTISKVCLGFSEQTGLAFQMLTTSRDDLLYAVLLLTYLTLEQSESDSPMGVLVPTLTVTGQDFFALSLGSAVWSLPSQLPVPLLVSSTLFSSTGDPDAPYCVGTASARCAASKWVTMHAKPIWDPRSEVFNGDCRNVRRSQPRHRSSSLVRESTASRWGEDYAYMDKWASICSFVLPSAETQMANPFAELCALTAAAILRLLQQDRSDVFLTLPHSAAYRLGVFLSASSLSLQSCVDLLCRVIASHVRQSATLLHSAGVFTLLLFATAGFTLLESGSPPDSSARDSLMLLLRSFCDRCSAMRGVIVSCAVLLVYSYTVEISGVHTPRAFLVFKSTVQLLLSIWPSASSTVEVDETVYGIPLLHVSDLSTRILVAAVETDVHCMQHGKHSRSVTADVVEGLAPLFRIDIVAKRSASAVSSLLPRCAAMLNTYLSDEVAGKLHLQRPCLAILSLLSVLASHPIAAHSMVRSAVFPILHELLDIARIGMQPSVVALSVMLVGVLGQSEPIAVNPLAEHMASCCIFAYRQLGSTSSAKQGRPFDPAVALPTQERRPLEALFTSCCSVLSLLASSAHSRHAVARACRRFPPSSSQSLQQNDGLQFTDSTFYSLCRLTA